MMSTPLNERVAASDLFSLSPARIDLFDHLRLAGTESLASSVTHYVMKRNSHGLTEPSQTGDATMAVVHLQARGARDMWRDGRHAVIGPLGAGALTIHDLRRSLVFDLAEPFHTVNFQLPRHLLDTVADECDLPRIDGLDRLMQVANDEVMQHLAFALLPCFAGRHDSSRLFADQLMAAIALHMMSSYGDKRPRERPRHSRGGLAPWQERRAKDMLLASLGADLAMYEVAGACGLSATYFSCAFRVSTGVAPHRWMTEQRVAEAKRLLGRTNDPLSEIAVASGFSDQSHFTRIFSKIVGISPGQWRRANKV